MQVLTGQTKEQNPLTARSADEVDLLAAAELVARRFGPRAITLLTAGRLGSSDRWDGAHISANDAFAALPEAARKMARVALRRYRAVRADRPDFAAALDTLFPDAVAYLARCIKSVVADEARAARREPVAISLETPLAGAADPSSDLHLGDTLAETSASRLPEEALLESADRADFRAALGQALRGLPSNYLAALRRDIARERERRRGLLLEPESDRSRQTLCRARAALAKALLRECGADNPYIRLLMQQRSVRVRPKMHPSGRWTEERQESLLRRLMDTQWTERSEVHGEGRVEEAVVNDVTAASPIAPPSPEMRQAMRVLDLYTVDRPTPRTPAAAAHYERARALRKSGDLEGAVKSYRACYDAEPTFIEALNEIGVVYSQMGHLREALRIYLSIIERDPPGDHKFIAATNAADIYLTWFDSGRSKERNIELAIKYAQLAMTRPTPMRACNLILAYVKDRYYEDARQVLQSVLRDNPPRCPKERFLETLFQIRDPDLVAWWSWLDDEMSKEEGRQ